MKRNDEQQEAVILWLAKYIAADGERSEWVTTPQLGIRKTTLNFASKFLWLLVRNRVSRTKVDNQFTWDRAVMIAALVVGVKIDFARILLAEIHEGIQDLHYLPLSMFDFFNCAGWYCDGLIHPTGALDIGLIRDEANLVEPRREP